MNTTALFRLPGSKHALAYCWRGDNQGPPTSAIEVLTNAKKLQKQFSMVNPHAWIYRAGLISKNSSQKTNISYHHGKHSQYGHMGENVVVKSSTLDEYVKAVQDEGVWNLLPTITTDLSDTWIWGVSSDPIKTQRARAIVRSRTICEKVFHATLYL